MNELILLWTLIGAAYITFLVVLVPWVVQRSLGINPSRIKVGKALDRSIHFLNPSSRENNKMPNFIQGFQYSRKTSFYLSEISGFYFFVLSGAVMNVKRGFFTESIRTQPDYLMRPMFRELKGFKVGFIVNNQVAMYTSFRDLAITTSYTLEEEGHLKPRFMELGSDATQRAEFASHIDDLASSIEKSNTMGAPLVEFCMKWHQKTVNGMIKDKDVLFAFTYLSWIRDLLWNGPKYFGESARKINISLSKSLKEISDPFEHNDYQLLLSKWEDLTQKAIAIAEEKV